MGYSRTVGYLADGRDCTSIQTAVDEIWDLLDPDGDLSGEGVQTINIYPGGNRVGDAYHYDENVDADTDFHSSSAADHIVIQGMVPHNGLRETGIVVRADTTIENGFHAHENTEVNDISITRQGTCSENVIGLLLEQWAKANRVLVYDIITTKINMYAALFAVPGHNEIINCAIINCKSTATDNGSARGIWTSGSENKIYNCTVVNITHGDVTDPSTEAGAGIVSHGTAPVITNCIVTGSSQNDFLATAGTPVVNYCISSDDTADDWDGVGGHDNQINKDPDTDIKFTKTTAGSENIHIQYGSCAMGAGTDLSGEGFNDDIEGDTRTYWDIGADEYPELRMIKILPRDFISNLAANPEYITGGSNVVNAAGEDTRLIASIPIPPGFKATHVRVYGSAQKDVNVYEVDIDTASIISRLRGSGNTSAEIDITDITSNSTNFLRIHVEAVDGYGPTGGYVTIEPV